MGKRYTPSGSQGEYKVRVTSDVRQDTLTLVDSTRSRLGLPFDPRF